jgi:hypothetical protein
MLETQVAQLTTSPARQQDVQRKYVNAIFLRSEWNKKGLNHKRMKLNKQ